MTTNPSTSISLVQRVQSFEPDAWTVFARLYSPLVYRWIRQCGLQSQDAADVMQNVFVSVIHGVERFTFERPESSFRGWLWTVSRNAVRTHVRQQRAQATARGLEIQDLVHEQADLSDSSRDPSDFESFSALTHRALAVVRERVEARVWEAFWRTTVGSESAPEVATALGMTPTAVRQVKFRVLGQLRDLLADR